MTKARDLANGGFGLVLVKPSSVVNGTDNGKGTVSFSAVSTVSLNGVFSSTYTNYRILWKGNASGAVGVKLRLRAAGSDVTSGNYFYEEFVANGTSVSASRASTQTGFALGAMSNNFKHFIQTELASPFLAEETNYESKSAYNNTTSTHLFYTLAGFCSVTASADGFTLYADSGTISGEVSVYGYNK
jgi:hypothetical protein